MLQLVNSILDWVWLGLIAPTASFMGDLLEMCTLAPMNTVGIPLVIQVAVIGGLAASLSICIKRLLKVEEKEAGYLEEIERKKHAAQDALSAIGDWKVKEVLQNASDSEIDEIYNTYISKKFAWFGSTYLVPVFITLFWLDTRHRIGQHRFLVEFHDSSLGVPGLSVPLVFFFGYCMVLFLNRMMKRFKEADRNSILKHIEITRKV